MKDIITIDGPVASGKTTVGEIVASRLNWRMLDTGLMYRAVTRTAIDRGIELNNEIRLTSLCNSINVVLQRKSARDSRLYVDGHDITDTLRHPDVEAGVSLTSQVLGVRLAMVELQRVLANQGPVVMVGRDIGTVVLPDAPIKIYLSASIKERTQRRFKQLHTEGGSPVYDELKASLIMRDKIDSERAMSPLKPAADAHVIHTDFLEVAAVAEEILRLTDTL